MNGRQTPNRLRNAMALAVSGCLALTCQGEYPIAPTLCDDWCRASENVRCGDWLDDPASCVANCESYQMPSTPECVANFRNVIECLNKVPPTNDYCGQQPPICAAEYAAMDGCTSVPDVPIE